MNKKIVIVSFDDVFEGNDGWKELLSFKKDFPAFKFTGFVIPGRGSDDFLRKIDVDWMESALHGYKHGCEWLGWTKEKAKELLLYYQKEFNFIDGFKAPGWKLTSNIIEACRELDFWINSIRTVPVDIKRYWYTTTVGEGLIESANYVEVYAHIQRDSFKKSLDALRVYAKTHELDFKFISEILKYND